MKKTEDVIVAKRLEKEKEYEKAFAPADVDLVVRFLTEVIETSAKFFELEPGDLIVKYRTRDNKKARLRLKNSQTDSSGAKGVIKRFLNEYCGFTYKSIATILGLDTSTIGWCRDSKDHGALYALLIQTYKKHFTDKNPNRAWFTYEIAEKFRTKLILF